ncbi:thiamine pyrophosphate-binding protein [Amycolatopsis sp. NPDC059657]|uniref:thiamine pyrophosphate-binding protein n=1 Tax=Amycolatopsis sp. NPDC059657 TaxID=3346899 RepID=UPI003671157D
MADVLAESDCAVVMGLPSDEPGLLDAAARKGATAVKVFGDQRIAGCAAAGYAMVSRAPVVLALNSGPSFANAMPALVEAASLGVPLVVVTTRAPSATMGRGGFQHLEQQRMLGSLASWQYLVDCQENLAWAVARALRLAVAGRGGITMVEISDEVTRLPFEGAARKRASGVPPARSVPDPDHLDAAARLLSEAERPLIIIGGGARWSGGGRSVLKLAEQLGAPVFTTAAGRGSVSEHHELNFGLVGLYSTPPAEALLETADVILVLGSRLEETARMRWENRHAAIIQVDKSVYAFGEGPEPDLCLLGDLRLTAEALIGRLGPGREPARRLWQARQSQVRYEQSVYATAPFEVSPVRAAIRLTRELVRPRVIVQENGLHDIWGYHFPVLRIDDGTDIVCPGEQTMMGFGVAASAGAAMARQGPVVVFTGDAALRLSVGALPVFGDHGLGVVTVMFDNGGYGWPRHLRKARKAEVSLTEARYWDNVEEICAAFGGWGITARTEPALVEALRHAKDNAAAGRFSVVRVPVPDHDIPAGVLAMDEEQS